MTNVAPPAPHASARVHEFTTHSGADTIEVGRKLVKLLKPPQLLILRGDLGTGKTTLVKGIAEALDAAEAEEVTSPTFTLIHEYEGTRTLDGRKEPVVLYHLDLYRIQNERQLDSLGLEELSTPDSIVLVEWGEKFPSVMRRSNGEIEMRATGGDTRSITLTLKD
jgi:tRNA threonylcarbamoyladenosine biosynthesis protein TsaE